MGSDPPTLLRIIELAMLAFVDESGDAGMQKKVGSSEFFVICAVLFLDNADAHACDKRIDELRRECFRGKNIEFRFNKCCKAHRKLFLNGIMGHEFLYMAFVLNKAKLYGPGFKFKDPFYKYTCKLLFENAKPYLTNASVIIDGSGDRSFRKQLQRYLKEKINTDSQTIRKVKIEKSHKNNLLQLADMIVGSIARYYRKDKADRFDYRGIVGRAEIGVQVWPKK
jgi:hypothetical protein